MKITVVSLVILVCTCFTASAAETEPGDHTLSPYFWVKPTTAGPDGPGAKQPDPLPLKSTRVEATIVGVFADVKVTQRYSNSGGMPLEAVYIFPGSTRAAVHGLTMTIGDRRLEAKTKERGEARKIYDTAKSAGKTASLLEQQRPNVFQMNVANIMPGDDIAVELRYTEMLVPTDGVYEFVYPGVVGPRYSNTPGVGASPDAAWVQNPYLAKGEVDLATYELKVELVTGVPLQDVQCRTHATQIVYGSEREAQIEVSDTNVGNRDFVLNYRLTGGEVQSGLLLAEGKDEKFFLLTVQPPARPKPEQIPPREFVFIVDVSGSMNGFPLNTARRMLGDLLATLRTQDLFNLLLFAGGNEVFAENSVPATPQAIADAQRLLSRQSGSGATELLPALRRAFAMPQSQTVARTFLIITDGYVDVEAEAFELVRANLGQANLFAFGIGASVNRHLIEGLARSGQGEPFIATDPEMATEIAAKFRAYVSTPLLTRVKVEYSGFDAYDLEPGAIPDLLANRPLVVFGKWRGPEQGRLVVSGLSGTTPYQAEHDVARAIKLDDSESLSRQWARSRIFQLGDLQDLKATEERKALITNLGLTYNLLTRFTSFIAVDDLVRRTTPDLKTIKQPLPLPAGVENSAVGGGGAVPATPEPSTYALAVVGAISLVIASRWRRRRAQRDGSTSNDRTAPTILE